MNNFKYLFVFLLLLPLGLSLKAQTHHNDFIRDSFYTETLKKELLSATEQKDAPTLEELRNQVEAEGTGFSLQKTLKTKPLSPEEVYQNSKESVLVLGKLYRQPNASEWKLYQASAFVIDPSGICVTNYHVFGKMWNGKVEEKGMGVLDISGKFYPVEKVLCASKTNDIVVFKIATHGKKLAYLSLGKNAQVGSDVFIISHPAGKFYYFSTGRVTRKYWYKNSQRMSISANFALGSSGAPILNTYGQVIGMVAATISLPSSRYVQMMVKEIIPVSSIRQLADTTGKP